MKLRAARFGVQIPSNKRDLSLLRNIQNGSGATQPPIQWIFQEKSVWDVEMTLPSSAVFKNECRYTYTTLHAFMACTGTIPHCYIYYSVPYKYGINHFVCVHYSITRMVTVGF